MHPDLQNLIQLQDLDLAADRARRRIADMPAAQGALEARIAERSAAVNGVKERMAAAQANRREIEKELAALQARLSKYKGQLMEVKTNKEYQAMQKEIATAEESVRSQEDRILEQMEEAETLARELKVGEAALKSQQDDIMRDRSRLEGEASALQTRAHETLSARTALAKELSPAALRLFEHVSRQRKGLAVAEARDG